MLYHDTHTASVHVTKTVADKAAWCDPRFTAMMPRKRREETDDTDNKGDARARNNAIRQNRHELLYVSSVNALSGRRALDRACRRFVRESIGDECVDTTIGRH